MRRAQARLHNLEAENIIEKIVATNIYMELRIAGCDLDAAVSSRNWSPGNGYD